MELKDKVVIITGGSKGFGRALAEAFIKEGAKVAICALNKDELNKTAKEIDALGIVADVTKEEDMQRLTEETLKNFGKLDIWINNAGVWITGPVEDANMKEVKKMFDINIIGAINGSRVALRYMKEKGKGVIIDIISRAALEGRPGIALYAATKWGLNGFNKSIREENKGSGISIFSVFPGGMKTEIFGKNKPANFDDFMDVKDVAKQVIENLKKEKPEEELVIKR